MTTSSAPTVYYLFTSRQEHSLDSLLSTCISIEEYPDHFITVSASPTLINALDEAYQNGLRATTSTLRRAVRTKLHQVLDDLSQLIQVFMNQQSGKETSGAEEADFFAKIDLDLRETIKRYRNELDKVLDMLFSQKDGESPVDRDQSVQAHILSFAERWIAEICIIPALRCRGSIIVHLPSLSYIVGHGTGSCVGVDIAPTESISKLRESFIKMGGAVEHGFAETDGRKMLYVNEASIGRDLAIGKIVRFDLTDENIALFANIVKAARSGGGH